MDDANEKCQLTSQHTTCTHYEHNTYRFSLISHQIGYEIDFLQKKNRKEICNNFLDPKSLLRDLTTFINKIF